MNGQAPFPKSEPKSGPEPAPKSGLIRQAGALRHVDHWVFDLDNTLYSAECRIFHQVDRRMGEFIAEMFGLPFEEGRRIQKAYYRSHGTTLRGLMLEHGVDPRGYLDYVHDIDLSVIEPVPALDAALNALDGPKTIFTNASRQHAEQIIDRLGIARHFRDIFDIHDADYVPKPADETFDAFIARHAIDGPRSVLFEDTAANLKPAAARGMTTVLITPGEAGVDNDRTGPHIHHVTDDLAAWLAAIAEARKHDAASGEG